MFSDIFRPPFLALSQDNVTITTKDSRMHFEGTWFDQDSGGHETTATLGSSVSLVFPGTAIYWHATLNPNCGIGNVTVDDDSGVQIDASIGTSQNDSAIPAILFSRTGLEAGISHSINITFFAHGSLGGPYMEVYNFSYTQDSTATSTVSGSSTIISGSSTSISGSSPSSGTSHKSNTGAIAGGVVGGLLGGVLLFACVLFLVRRKLRTRDDGEPTSSPYIAERSSTAPLGSKSAAINSMSTSPFFSRPQPQPESYSQQSTSEPIPTPTHTASDSPSPSIPIPIPILAPNRNEPAPSIADVPPPPYIPRSDDGSAN